MSNLILQNKVAQPSANGQSVRITLAQAQLQYLAELVLDAPVTIDSSSKKGYVENIDLYGNSFLVRTQYPTTRLDSLSTPHFIAVNETVSITL